MYHCMLKTLAWDGSGPFHSRPRWPHFWWFQSIWKRGQWCHIPLQRDRNPLPKTSQDIPRPKIVKPPLCCECASRKSLVASKELASNPTSKRSFDTKKRWIRWTMSRQAAHIRIQKKHETKNKRKCIIVYPNWYLWKPMAFESAHQGHTWIQGTAGTAGTAATVLLRLRPWRIQQNGWFEEISSTIGTHPHPSPRMQ